MAGYILSERAQKDLLTIGDYTRENWSEEQAEMYVRMLLSSFSDIAEKPMIGRSYDTYRAGIRGCPCGKHVIFYRIIAQGKIRIVRVLHEKMDFPRHI